MDRHTKQQIKLELREKIRHCAMNTKMSFLWKWQMFDMQQSNVGGIP
jgi:hypothetical protein